VQSAAQSAGLASWAVGSGVLRRPLLEFLRRASAAGEDIHAEQLLVFSKRFWPQGLRRKYGSNSVFRYVGSICAAFFLAYEVLYRLLLLPLLGAVESLG
jgi:hypothetical protein